MRSADSTLRRHGRCPTWTTALTVVVLVYACCGTAQAQTTVMSGAMSDAVSITFNNAGADPSVARSSQNARPVSITFNNAGSNPSVVRSSQNARPVSITFNNPGADLAVVRSSQDARPVSITFNNPGTDSSVLHSSQIARPVSISFNNAGVDPTITRSSAVSRPLSLSFNNSGPDPAHPLMGASQWISVGYCSCTFDPAAAAFPREGGSGQVDVTTDVSNCQWGAQSPVTWVRVTAGVTMTGAGVVQFTVARNPTFQTRQAKVSVGGVEYTVTQEGWPFAAVPTFTDDPLTARTTRVKAVHVAQLRAAIDDLRTRFGLSSMVWTDATLGSGTGTSVKAAHLAEMRTALNAVYDAADRTRPVYTDPNIVVGQTVIAATHIAQLRAAIAAIWSP